MTAALAAPEETKVQYGYRGSDFKAIEIEGRCFVTPATAKSWGWNVTLSGEQLQISGEGRQFHMPVKTVGGERYFDLSEAGGYVGAKMAWDGKVFRLLGSVRSVGMTEKGVEVASTIQVQPKVFRLDNPPRLVMDFYGAHLESKLVKEVPAWWRVSQFQKDVVRVVIDHPGVVAAAVSAPKATRFFSYDLPLVCLKAPADVTSTEIRAAQQAAGATAKAPAGMPVILDLPKVVSDTENDVLMRVHLSGVPAGTPAMRYVSPTQVQLSVPKAQIVEMGSGPLAGTRWVKSYTMAGDASAAVLLLETAQPMAFSLSTSGQTVSIRLTRPRAADSTLAGKVIVIDAGHGGRDPGARYGNVQEKDIALPISLELGRLLSAAGASVVSTRTDDSYPSLGARAQVANDSNADLFVSVHINSNSKVNSRSGMITFYHQHEAVGRLLAECIHAEIAKVNNLPDIGVWSDNRIYQSGFKVLRDTNMPGVLLELGFINHSTDRAEMTKKDFPVRVAQAVVRGIRVFLGEKES